MNVINESEYKAVETCDNAGNESPILQELQSSFLYMKIKNTLQGNVEVGFSMVRLKEIATLREMFSSIESLSNESSDSDVSFCRNKLTLFEKF